MLLVLEYTYCMLSYQNDCCNIVCCVFGLHVFDFGLPLQFVYVVSLSLTFCFFVGIGKYIVRSVSFSNLCFRPPQTRLSQKTFVAPTLPRCTLLKMRSWGGRAQSVFTEFLFVIQYAPFRFVSSLSCMISYFVRSMVSLTFSVVSHGWLSLC